MEVWILKNEDGTNSTIRSIFNYKPTEEVLVLSYNFASYEALELLKDGYARDKSNDYNTLVKYNVKQDYHVLIAPEKRNQKLIDSVINGDEEEVHLKYMDLDNIIYYIKNIDGIKVEGIQSNNPPDNDFWMWCFKNGKKYQLYGSMYYACVSFKLNMNYERK